MTPQPTNDTKLLFVIAAGVAAGAIGLTALVGLRETAPTTREARAVPRAATPVTPPQPLRSESAEPAKLAGSTIDAEVAARAALLVDETAPPLPPIDLEADLFAEGSKAWHARDFATAAAYFAADAESRPRSAYTHYMLGLSLWKSGRAEHAVEALRRSSELNDRSIRTFLNLARVESERGEYAAALEAAERALGLESDSAAGLYQRARALRGLGRVDEAVVDLQTCLALHEDHGDAHNLLGLIGLERGDWDGALAALERAAQLEPRRAYVLNNLGLALERNGRADEAVAAFRRAVELEGHAAAAASLARLQPAAESIAAGAAPTRLAGAGAPGEPQAEPQSASVASEPGPIAGAKPTGGGIE